MIHHVRRCRGSAITELGPALFVLLILIFFPLMDIIGAAADYSFANLLNQAEVRELAVQKPDDGQKENIAQKADLNTINALLGFAKFCGIAPGDEANPAKIKHTISYIPSLTDPAKIGTVEVSTEVSFRPFLIIPFIPDVPGLSANIPFKVSSTRPQEELGSNG